MRVYDPAVPVEPAPSNTHPSPPDPTGARPRRAPSQTEQARRKAWGKEWGKVGHDHSKLIRAREA